MAKSGVIGVWQAVLLLSLSRMFSVMTMCLSECGYSIHQMFYSSLAAVFVSFLLFLPAGLFFDAHPKLFDESRGGALWKGGYALLLFCWLVMNLIHLCAFLGNAVFVQTESLFLLLPAVLAGGWCAYQGLEGLARWNAVLFVLFLLSAALLLAGGLGESELWRLKPPSENTDEFFPAMLTHLAQNPELVFLPLLAPYIRPGRRALLKVGALYCAISGGLVSLFFGVVAFRFGDFTQKLVYPVFSLAASLQIGSLQRLDAIHMAIWVMLACLRISLLIWLCRQTLLSRRAEAQKREKIKIFGFIALAALALSALLADNRQAQSVSYALPFSGALLGLGALVLPVLARLFKKEAHR